MHEHFESSRSRLKRTHRGAKGRQRFRVCICWRHLCSSASGLDLHSACLPNIQHQDAATLVLVLARYRLQSCRCCIQDPLQAPRASMLCIRTPSYNAGIGQQRTVSSAAATTAVTVLAPGKHKARRLRLLRLSTADNCACNVRGARRRRTRGKGPARGRGQHGERHCVGCGEASNLRLRCAVSEEQCQAPAPSRACQLTKPNQYFVRLHFLR